MSHATYLLAAASGLVEGAVCPDGAAPTSAPVARLLPKGEGVGAGMAALAASAGWEPAPAVIVVATDTVGFRRLAFPFKDQRRIRQSLRYALESELLEQVDAYAVDHELIPEEEGAHAVVSLLRQDLLRSVLDAVAQSGLRTYRVLSSAHALLAARPAASPDHVQAYVGAEEAFLTVVSGGHIDRIVALPSALQSLLAELVEQGMTRPRDVTRLLAGESDDSRVNRSLLRTRLQHELQAVVGQIDRFLRVHPLPPGTTCSVHGLYAPWIALDTAQGTASFADPPRPAAGPERAALGILHELAAAPEAVLSPKGPSFYRAAATWSAVFAAVKRPLVALGVLLLLTLATAGGTYVVRTVALRSQIARTNEELQALVAKRVGGNVPESARVSVLREQLAALRERARAAARIAAVPYAVLGTFSDLSTQAATVPGITVQDVQISLAQATMEGQTPSYQLAETLRDKVGAIARFKGRTAKLTYQRAGQAIAYRITVQ
ncbi:MAG: type II secretion system protein GspL [SAR324 cluster bacterium]